MKKKYLFIGIGIVLVSLVFWFAINWYDFRFFLFGNLNPQTVYLPGVQPIECQVKNLKHFIQGGRPGWSKEGNLIAFDRKVGKQFEVFVIQNDGKNERCLTCNKSGGPAGHRGNPEFSSDGRFIVFTGENQYGKHGFANEPGQGFNNDIWLMTADGGKFYQLTHYPNDWGALHPHFSHDGKKIIWSEEYEKFNFFVRGKEFGFWRIKIAEFNFSQEKPQLKNEISLEPLGRVWYETHGFSLDNKKILFTAHQEGETAFYGDIYTYDLESDELQNLTQSSDLHDEHAQYSSLSRKISFISGPFIGFLKFYTTELHLMNIDGENKVKLTHFNDPGYPEFPRGKFVVGDNTWSPNGDQIIFIVWGGKETREQNLYLLTFEGPCGKL